MNLKNKNVAVLGLGIEGKDLVKYLVKQGAKVAVLDRKNEDELDFSELPESVNIVLGNDYLNDLKKYEIIFRSPGVYRYGKELIGAEKSGSEISSATKLFFDLCPAKIIGVTGTKGKGTTSTLIYEILKRSGKDVYLAGNIGKPSLELLSKLNKNSWVVMELSSFQLIDLTRSPHIAVVLNITTDHLDWHKDRDEYVAAKKNVVSHQLERDFSVLNNDYADSRNFSRLGKGNRYYFSRKDAVKGSYVKAGKIILNIDRQEIVVGDADDLLLRGEHNWENITAAIAASSLAGADIDSIKQTVFSFKGLEHRLELVRELDGVKYYNDSFSTGPETVVAAVKSFSEPITIILGGFDKGLDYKDMAKEIVKQGNVKSTICIGDIAKQMIGDLKKAKFKGKINDVGKPAMEDIVKMAKEVTPIGGVVLLSPGSSSFDMFKSYKERGNQFKESIKRL